MIKDKCSIETFADATVVTTAEFILREDGVEKCPSPPVPELQNLLAEIAVNHCKNGLEETILGQCSANFVFNLTFNNKLLSKKYTALPCHLLDQHDNDHRYNYSKEIKVVWSDQGASQQRS